MVNNDKKNGVNTKPVKPFKNEEKKADKQKRKRDIEMKSILNLPNKNKSKKMQNINKPVNIQVIKFNRGKKERAGMEKKDIPNKTIIK